MSPGARHLKRKLNGLKKMGKRRAYGLSLLSSQILEAVSYRKPSFTASSPTRRSSFETGLWFSDLKRAFTLWYVPCSSTRASISLALVKSKYRWMLTGTPVTNTLWDTQLPTNILVTNFFFRADIYGLLRFGRFRPWNDWNDFNEHVVCSQNLLSLRLSSFSPDSWCRPKCNTKMRL